MRKRFGLTAAALLLVGPSPAAQPGGDANNAAAAGFSQSIAPILLAKCVACHGPEKSKGDYRLDTFARLMQPGSSKEPPVVPGQPDRSHVFQLITAADPDDRMPQKEEPLPADSVALIRQWILGGAAYNGGDPRTPLVLLVPEATNPPPPNPYPAPVPVLSLAFDPKGDELAVSGAHEVTVWNAHTGALARRLTNITLRTQALDYSPDGQRLLVAGGVPGRSGDARILSAKDGSLVHRLARTRDMILAARHSPDGSRIVVGGTDNTVRLFDAGSGQELWSVEPHADWVLDLAFNPAGDRIASASRDRSVRLLDAKTGEVEEAYLGHNQAVFAAVFTADGQRVLSAGRDPVVHGWEAKDAKKILEIKDLPGDILRLRRSGDLLLSSARDGRLRLHRLGDKPELIRTFEGHADAVYALDLHEATHRLASGSDDGQVRLWDLDTGSLVLSFFAAPGWRPASEP